MEELRPGKQVWRGECYVERPGIDDVLRIVFEVTVQTVEADGQALLMPDVEVETYWTSLSDDPRDGGEVPGTWDQLPQRVKGRPGPGTVAIREILDQRAGATFGDDGLQPVEVDWKGVPARD